VQPVGDRELQPVPLLLGVDGPDPDGRDASRRLGHLVDREPHRGLVLRVDEVQAELGDELVAGVTEDVLDARRDVHDVRLQVDDHDHVGAQLVEALPEPQLLHRAT
jgi:hypothetical protein